MKACVGEVVSELRSGAAADPQETLLEATMLAEKFSGRDDWHGICPKVDDAEVTLENTALPRQTLVD